MSEGSEMLSKLLSSDIKGDLLVLFHKNPGLIDTSEGVARRIGRNADAIEPDVKDLLELGVLRRKKIGEREVIMLDKARDNEIQAAIEKHIRNLKV